MTIPEVGELWEYSAGNQLLRVLVLGVKHGGGDGVHIQTINIVCEGFGPENDIWWFSTCHTTAKHWKKVA